MLHLSRNPISKSPIPSNPCSSADQCSVKWIKALTLLERAAKLAFLDPEENSEWNRAWQAYDRTVQDNPSAPPPPPWLNQPRYRCPQAHTETKLGLDQFLANMGDEGVSPVDRMRNYQVDKAGRGLDIPTECIILVSYPSTLGLSTDRAASPSSCSMDAASRHQFAGLREQRGVDWGSQKCGSFPESACASASVLGSLSKLTEIASTSHRCVLHLGSQHDLQDAPEGDAPLATGRVPRWCVWDDLQSIL